MFVVMELMKLQYDIVVVLGGVVFCVVVLVGEVICEGYLIVYVVEDDLLVDWEGGGEEFDFDYVCDDFVLFFECCVYMQDENCFEVVVWW